MFFARFRACRPFCVANQLSAVTRMTAPSWRFMLGGMWQTTTRRLASEWTRILSIFDDGRLPGLSRAKRFKGPLPMAFHPLAQQTQSPEFVQGFHQWFSLSMLVKLS
jgi:hypothetical protein